MHNFFLIIFVLLFSWDSSALTCQCSILAYSPVTGPRNLKPELIKKFDLEEFGNLKQINQKKCLESCYHAFEKEMSYEALYDLLKGYSYTLIDQKVLGYSCTGVSVYKFPIRVKANLGHLGLGNVADFIEVIDLEVECF